jgi:hypothetical protein
VSLQRSFWTDKSTKWADQQRRVHRDVSALPFEYWSICRQHLTLKHPYTRCKTHHDTYQDTCMGPSTVHVTFTYRAWITAASDTIIPAGWIRHVRRKDRALIRGLARINFGGPVTMCRPTSKHEARVRPIWPRHYLINGTIFGEILWNIKCICWCFLNFCLKHFSI